MRITALLMAGGRGTRMSHHLEKPLIPICGKAMVERVLNAIQGSTRVGKILVVVSPNTPATAKRIGSKRGIHTIEAPGEGYIQDMRYVIRSRKLKTVLVISADLPLITPEIIDLVLEEYTRCSKPALMVAVRRDFYRQQGFLSNYDYSEKYGLIIPAGINVLDGTRINEGELKEEVLVLDRTEIAANINSREDLERARELAKEKRVHAARPV
ncbi:NTP transferase domain-containing protein [Candidatus Bathyarchaeota archaeon]|nr:NTP transferase domain-containing protein [Candidatus Bathyarchaeota archaeon]